MEKPSTNPSTTQVFSRKELLDQARELEHSPGVYLMRGEGGVVLYVGKAKSLRSRVTSYFLPEIHEIRRTELLLTRVCRFDVILTETESEALILEATLIKKHKPHFNIRLKDDKAYPYIRVQASESFPRLEWTRRVLRDGAQYFGPFPSAWTARQVMELLTHAFQLRDCSDNTFRHRSRPCILFEMGRCSAPCVGKIDGPGYQERLKEALRVLEGKGGRLIEELERGMREAAEKEDFETAAVLRDQLQGIRLVTETQTVVQAGIESDRDVIGIARGAAGAHGVILQIRGGKLLSVKHYHLQNVEPDVPDPEIITQLVEQHSVQIKAEEERVEKDGAGILILPAKEFLVPFAPNDIELIEQTFGPKVRMAETEVDRQLLNVAQANAEHSLEMGARRSHGHGIQALEQIQDKLHLSKLPQRIECYDISNIQGEDPVASRVVFIDGAPDKNLYRRYKIKTIEGSNDFAMMREVISRRFLRKDEALPDLVVVDGGRGQLSQAVAILEELDVQGVAAVGLAKARVESDFRSPEVKSSFERVFIPNRKNPVPLLPHTDAYKLLTHVRDEAHRFAIQYHRKVRDKRSLKSGEST